MMQIQNKFYSCIETRIQSQGEMYARFQIGTFFRGQALTVANALRRTLLGELPYLVVTKVEIDGVAHEFSTIPGVQESVLDILLNLKRLTFTITNNKFNLFLNSSLKTRVFLKIKGPTKVTAADLKLPSNLACVWPNSYIATLSSNAELVCILELAIIHPKQKLIIQSKPISSKLLDKKKKIFYLQPNSSPIRNVNYVIYELDSKKDSEYIALEIVTDGSIEPKQAVSFAFNQLTKLFYEFAQLSRNSISKK
uniref:Plastid-encoded RNA polymerase subunit alpha n=1 Tax=Dicloster acuatus TaxID=91190 RepID=A0A097KQI7_9CHLO|nr:alpha subunit of RNA polymerase [Dicloster acuatus]AIT95441.1 alpha subunit of RNA polymerase [Dicloster acuatus]